MVRIGVLNGRYRTQVQVIRLCRAIWRPKHGEIPFCRRLGPQLMIDSELIFRNVIRFSGLPWASNWKWLCCSYFNGILPPGKLNVIIMPAMTDPYDELCWYKCLRINQRHLFLYRNLNSIPCFQFEHIVWHVFTLPVYRGDRCKLSGCHSML